MECVRCEIRNTSCFGRQACSRTVFLQLPGAVISSVDRPLESPSVLSLLVPHAHILDSDRLK
jgi:hypothetical protein